MTNITSILDSMLDDASNASNELDSMLGNVNVNGPTSTPTVEALNMAPVEVIPPPSFPSALVSAVVVTVKCRSCSHSLPPDAKFCLNCGAGQLAPSVGIAGTRTAPAFVNPEGTFRRDTMIQRAAGFSEARNIPSFLELAGLVGTVSKAPLFYPVAPGANFEREVKVGENIYRSFSVNDTIYAPTSEKMLTVRDDGTVLGAVSTGYPVVQTAELLSPCAPLLESGAVFVGGGTFNDGRVVWAQLSVGDKITVKDLELNPYVTFRNSFDGTTAMVWASSLTMVVCWNTLMRATSGKEGWALAARHTKHVKRSGGKLDQAKALVLGIRTLLEAHAKELATLASWQIKSDEARKVLEALVWQDQSDDAVSELVKRRRDDEVSRLFGSWSRGEYTGAELDANRGTALGLVSVVSETADWRRRNTVNDDRPETRLFKGTGVDDKEFITARLLAARS